MGQCYKANREDLMRYISDINNQLNVKVLKFDDVVERRDGSLYKGLFVESNSYKLIPRYKSMECTNKNGINVYIDIPEFTFHFTINDLKYKRDNVFSTTINQKRIKVSIPDLSNFYNDFEKIEDYLETFINEYVLGCLKNIFSGKEKVDNWIFSTKANIKISLERKIIF